MQNFLCVLKIKMNERNSKTAKLSILVVTYNHENYIRKAIESIFNQNFDGLVELVIADDASSDGTFEIIKGYEEKDNRFSFKYLDSEKNIGITKNYQRGFAACTGEYVAVLEGDDYWVSPFKLQRQLDFLDTHWECDLCSVNYFVYEENRSNFYPRTTIGNGHLLISAKELIADNLVGNFSTCMYRKSALNALPNALFKLCSYDWIVNICVSRTSLIGFLEEPMSVYRLHSNGVWTQTPFIEQLRKQLTLIPDYDELTEFVFQKDFAELSRRLNKSVNAAQVAHIADNVIRPSVGFLTHLVEYMPPILLTMLRVLTPPKLKRLVVKIVQRGAA